MPTHLFLAFAAALVYTTGSFFLKRGLVEGASTRQGFHFSNLAIAAVFVPMVFFEQADVDWSRWLHPVTAGAMFYLGSLFTIVAIRKGDVSLVNPVLGTKVPFVALGSVLLIGQTLKPTLWAGAGLTAVGVFLLGGRAFFNPERRAKILPTVGLTLLSALCFGVTDVLVAKWAPDFGALTFAVVMIGCLALFSQLLNPFVFRGSSAPAALRKIPKKALLWLTLGGVFTGIQAALMAIALSFYNDPTGVNIVYGTRGLISVAIAWMFGNLLGNIEAAARDKDGRATMIWRLAGATVLTAGVIVAQL